MMMIDFILGVVVGGLAIWGIMRQYVAQIEADIAKATTRQASKAAAAPPVKTRKIGEGPKSRPRTEAKPAPKPEPEPAPEPEAEEPAEAEAEAEEPAEAAATEEPAEAADGTDGDPGDEEPAAKPKKPMLSLKLPEPSSAVDDSEE